MNISGLVFPGVEKFQENRSDHESIRVTGMTVADEPLFNRANVTFVVKHYNSCPDCLERILMVVFKKTTSISSAPLSFPRLK